jgi:hypothetical protein
MSTMTPTPPPTAAQQALLKNKDSVEILLDGMTDQRLDRTRTTPQSDGQASAAYHAEHTPHASGKAPSDDVPKVLLDRPLTPTGVSARRSPAPTRTYSSDATVFVPPQRMGLRLALAVVLGLLVAGSVFLVLEMTAKREVPAAATPVAVETTRPVPASASAPAPAPASASASAPASAPAPASGSAPASAAAASSSSARGHAVAPATTAVTPAAKRRTKATPSTSGDVGEFRTNF